MEQIGIALTGVIAIWLSQDKREGWRRYACLFGLAGQPFWFYSSYQTEQWGIFVLCFFYAWAWIKGFRNHWMKAKVKQWKPGDTLYIFGERSYEGDWPDAPEKPSDEGD